MSESTMRGRVMQALKPLHPVAIENSVGIGTPDINFVGGWMELKKLKRWPVRASTPVRVPHYTPHQRLFARQRARAGGHVWLLLQVGREYILLHGLVAALHLGTATQEEIAQHAWAYWPKGLNDEELLACVRLESSPEASVSSLTDEGVASLKLKLRPASG